MEKKMSISMILCIIRTLKIVLHVFQRTGMTVTKKHLQHFYSRKVRQAKQKGDEQRLKAITNYCKRTGGGQGLSAGKSFLLD
jgi:sugar phosphate permease